MREKQMKGITCCGECGSYDWKKHRCSRPCKDEGDAQSNFYADCPLPDVAHAVHGTWKTKGNLGICPMCGEYVKVKSPYCPNCGACMDGGEKHE